VYREWRRSVEYVEWAPYYDRIQREFGFSLDRENASADRLLALLAPEARRAPLPRLAPRLRGRDAIVVGLAPGAGGPPIWRLPPSRPPPAIVAADGAAARCLDAGLVPDVITTDLDGPVASEIVACARGAALVVHAHGDNVAQLEEWVPQMEGEVAGSWAGPPSESLLDVGGFTDGDRAACLAAHLGARRILLWGFEFDSVDDVGEPDRARKLAKLRWARTVLDLLAQGPIPLLTWRRDATLVPYVPGAVGSMTQ
jgi:2-amino-4-hydroxy-6-hydroxymethyldihydropteridine diphosphokinase